MNIESSFYFLPEKKTFHTSYSFLNSLAEKGDKKRRDICWLQASTCPNSWKKQLRAYLHIVFQKSKFWFLKNLLIFSNFQKNADVSSLKIFFLFIIFMTHKIL